MCTFLLNRFYTQWITKPNFHNPYCCNVVGVVVVFALLQAPKHKPTYHINDVRADRVELKNKCTKNSDQTVSVRGFRLFHHYIHNTTKIGPKEVYIRFSCVVVLRNRGVKRCINLITISMKFLCGVLCSYTIKQHYINNNTLGIIGI